MTLTRDRIEDLIAGEMDELERRSPSFQRRIPVIADIIHEHLANRDAATEKLVEAAKRAVDFHERMKEDGGFPGERHDPGCEACEEVQPLADALAEYHKMDKEEQNG